MIPHHYRQAMRLKEYDYSSQGAYFVTVCTKDRQCLFGEIADGKMRLNAIGQMVQSVWDELPRHYPGIDIDAFVVMPNHVHGIIMIVDVGAGSPRPNNDGITVSNNRGAETAPLRRPTLGQITAYFKYQSTKQINEIRTIPGVPVWQRNYYERVIRNEAELHRIREYIVNNPLTWEQDENHPKFLDHK